MNICKYHPDDEMNGMFKELTEEEEQQFAEYARANDPEMGGWPIYHPACRKVWRERGFKPATPQERLEYIRGELDAERISYGELAELADLKDYIEPGDVQLLEAAGVPEFPEEEQ